MDLSLNYMFLLCLLPTILAPLFILSWGVSYFLFLPVPERHLTVSHGIKRLHQGYFIFAILCYSTALIFMLGHGPSVVIFNPVIELAAGKVLFPIDLLFDSATISFLLLGQILCAIVAKFSYHYLYLEKRRSKFFFYLFFFLLGYQIVIPAQNFNLIMLGWEILGLSSVLLVGFFNDRHRPLESSLKVFFIYRMADILLLVSLILLHEQTLKTSILSIASVKYYLQYCLLIFIVLVGLVKASLFPLRSWLPIAMEGPTPSSAIFYGGLSVHVGIFLLIKISPLILRADFFWLRVVFCCYLAIVFLRSTFLLKKVFDYKSIQSYKTLQHLALISIEIMIGQIQLAMMHTFLHAIYRTFQFLQAPQQFLDFIHSKRQEGPVEMGSHLFWDLFEMVSVKLDQCCMMLKAKILCWFSLRKIYFFAAVLIAFIFGSRASRSVFFDIAFLWQNLDLLAWLGFVLVLTSVFNFNAKGKIKFLVLGQILYWPAFLIINTGEMREVLLITGVTVLMIYTVLYLIYDLMMPGDYRANLVSYHGVSHYFPGLAHWHFFFVLCLIGFPVSYLFFGQEVVLEHLLHEDALGLALPFALGGLLTGYQLLLIHLRFFYGPANPVFQLATMKAWNLRGIYVVALALFGVMVHFFLH